MKLVLIGSIAAATGALALSGCGGGDDGDIEAFCDKVDEVQAAGNAFAGVTGNDIEGATEALEEAQGLIDEVAEVAPEDIQSDVESVQDFFAEFVGAIQDADNPQDFLAIATDFQDEAQDFQATTERLETYTQENCGEG